MSSVVAADAGNGAFTVGWRERAWDRLVAGPWDLLVVGGGITGAGIARRAARAGLRVALVERGDLGSGTSSRSSKLVHGGLRYLAHGQVGVVQNSVRGREALLRAAPGLVSELGFLIPTFRGASPGRWTMAAGLAAYDLLAGRRTHRHLGRAELELLAPRLRTEGLRGGFRYGDAWTDDARLVLRVVGDAARAGATACSYASAQEVLRGADGQVAGVRLRDVGPDASGREAAVLATVVVNATGASADLLRAGVGGRPRIRPLRGSHLVFPAWRFPVAQAVSVGHPADGRPVFAYPWEGVTLVGTTDVDEPGDLAAEPAISAGEVAYLEAWCAFAFPSLDLRASDAVASYAGVRPVIGSGRPDPSAESREHVEWAEQGLLTVTGGKLTTFDTIARDALHGLEDRLAGRSGAGALDDPGLPPLDQAAAGDAPAADRAEAAGLASLDPDALGRIVGRYGTAAGALLAAAEPGELEMIPGTRDPWAALRWAARAEGVVHLEDLLLRRVRLGLLLPGRRGRPPRPDRGDRPAGAGLGRDSLGRRGERVPGPLVSGLRAARPPGRDDSPMSADNLLAIDVGTQSVRAMVFDPRGELVGRSKVPIEPYVSPRPGWAENDPELYWGAVGEACRALRADPAVAPGSIAGLALTTQRSTVVALDSDGRPLRPAIVWLDQRRTEGIPALGGPTGLAFRALGVSATVAAFQADAEANWLKANEPATWARTARFLFLSGFLAHRLVGRYVDADAAQVGYVPFDYKRRRWAARSDWKWRAVAIEPDMLPELVVSGQPLGELTDAAAAHLGLPAGLPVIAAGADKACEVLGSGALDPSIGALSFGTTATINTTHRRYVEPIPLVPPYPAALPGAYSLEIQVYRGFWLVEWFRREFGAAEEAAALARGIDPVDVLDELLGTTPPGAMGLVFQPTLSPGVRIPGPEAKGAAIGLGDVHTRGHLYRSVVEGLAYALREGAERTEARTKVPITTLRASGGGARSDRVVQIAADVFGLPVGRPHTTETSGLGAAIDAAVGLGIHPSFEVAVAEMTRVAETRDPDAAARERYDALYRRVYLPLYERLRPLYEAIREITGYPG